MNWDKINHWLKIGNITLMFGDWFGWLTTKPTIKQFNFFTITWDTGAWWGLETKKAEKRTLQGNVNHFFQIVVLGIGLRINWKRKTTVFLPNFKKLISKHANANEDKT